MVEADFTLLTAATPILKSDTGKELTVIYDIQETIGLPISNCGLPLRD